MAKDELSDFGGEVTTLTPALLDSGDATRAEFCELNDGILEAALGRSELFAGLIASVSALDTAQKRESAINVGLPFRASLPAPDGSIDAEDRAQLVYLYSGPLNVVGGIGPVTTIVHWRKLDGARLTIVFTMFDILRVDFTTRTYVSILPAGYSITGERAWWWTHATIADKIVVTNGTDPPLEWNGVAAQMSLLTLPLGVTKPQFIVWWKNRLHLFNITESGVNKPYGHHWSELFIYNQWDLLGGAGSDSYTGGGEPIMAVADLENILFLMKQNRVTVLAHTGISGRPFSTRDLETIRGTFAPFSMQVTSFGVLYLAVDGLRVFDGVSSRLVSGHVDAFSNIPITTLEKASSVLDSVFKRYLLALPSVVGGDNDTVWNILYQFFPGDRMEFSRRPYPNSAVRSMGKFIREEAFTWQSFGASERWQDVVIVWNDPKAAGEFEELVAGGYESQLWVYEDTAVDLGNPVPMVWESGVLPKDIGRQQVRLQWVTIGVVQSTNTTLVVEVLDAESSAVRFTKTLDLSGKRTFTVYPNRAFDSGFRLRFRNVAVGSIPVVDRVVMESLVATRFR